jgi:hypothetical protein
MNTTNMLSSSPPADSRDVERALYLILRTGIAIVGLFVVLATLSSHLFMPDLYYDEPPGPPPLRTRIPEIILGLAVGVLLLVPHRWTRRAWLFWPRLAFYSTLAVYLLWRAVEGILAGLGSGKSWHIFPASVIFGFIGLALPLCFLWSRRLQRGQNEMT